MVLPAEQAALLDALRQLVPKTTDVNGTETQTRYMSPAELGQDPRAGAAKILLLGELEAAVGGEPEPHAAQVVWGGLRREICDLMLTLASAPEVTVGAKAQPRQQHAREALELLGEIDRNTAAMLQQVDDGDERRWLAEGLADVAALALRAGAMAQAAHGKAIEADAVRDIKVLKGANTGATQTSRRNADTKARRLARMAALIDDGHTEARAAEIAHREGLGASAAANRKLHQRSGRK